MSTTSPPSELFRRVMGSFPTGITVLTAEREPGQVHGMTANSFTSVSLNPLLILVCVDHKARLLSHLRAKRRFGVNILKDSQQALSQLFAKPQQDPPRKRAWVSAFSGLRRESRCSKMPLPIWPAMSSPNT